MANEETKALIEGLEEELRQAMLVGDVDALDKLIDDKLVFVGPTGVIVTKEMDLDAHRSKLQKLTQLELLEREINVRAEFVTVVAKFRLAGEFCGADISGDYQYLRIWSFCTGAWHVCSGSVTRIV